MKVKQIFEMLEVLGYQTPVDMTIAEAPMYYSESRDKEICVLDMDLIHLIRAFNKLQNTKDLNFDRELRHEENINQIFNSLVEYIYDLKREVQD